MKIRPYAPVAVAAAVIFILAVGHAQQASDRFTEDLLKSFAYRALGPYRAGSWVTSFAVPAIPARDHLYTLYVGTRNGGVWKTVNNGTTFEPVFDAQPKLSIGDVAVAPSDPNIVWVGTGEAYCARSSNSGDGVWKSVTPWASPASPRSGARPWRARRRARSRSGSWRFLPGSGHHRRAERARTRS